MRVFMKPVKNPQKTGSPIVDYPVSVAELDPGTGQAIYDPDNGMWKSRGEVAKWSIDVGETLAFPAYVADYLGSVYAFLSVGKGFYQDEQENLEENLDNA